MDRYGPGCERNGPATVVVLLCINFSGEVPQLQPVADFCVGDNVKLTCTVASNGHSWIIYNSSPVMNISAAISLATNIFVSSPFTLRLETEEDGTITSSVNFVASAALNRTRITCSNSHNLEGEFQESVVIVLGELAS